MGGRHSNTDLLNAIDATECDPPLEREAWFVPTTAATVLSGSSSPPGRCTVLLRWPRHPRTRRLERGHGPPTPCALHGRSKPPSAACALPSVLQKFRRDTSDLFSHTFEDARRNRRHVESTSGTRGRLRRNHWNHLCATGISDC